MTFNGSAVGVPYTATTGSGQTPPLSKNLISWTFKVAPDSLYSRDVISATAENARFVSSYCLKLTGDVTTSTSYRPPATIDGTLGKSWAVEFDYIHTANVGGVGYVFSCCTASNLTTFLHGIYVGGAISGNDKLGYWDGVSANSCATTLTQGVKYTLKVKSVNQTGDTSKNDISFYINGGLISTVTGLPARELQYIESIGGRSSSTTNSGTGSLWNLKIYNSSDVVVAYYPFQKSGHDVSGNGHHSTRLTTGVEHNLQDTLHYNLINGCDIYTRDASPTVRADDQYMPYLNSAPVVTSLTGYTKTQTCPAGSWHNGCETKVVVGTTGVKDATGWIGVTSVKTQNGTTYSMVSTAEKKLVDNDEIFINHTTSPVGYCKEVDVNTMAAVSVGNYVFLDTSTTNRRKNLIWYPSSVEPENNNSLLVHSFIHKTDFIIDDDGVSYVYDDDNHIVTEL